MFNRPITVADYTTEERRGFDPYDPKGSPSTKHWFAVMLTPGKVKSAGMPTLFCASPKLSRSKA